MWQLWIFIVAWPAALALLAALPGLRSHPQGARLLGGAGAGGLAVVLLAALFAPPPFPLEGPGSRRVGAGPPGQTSEHLPGPVWLLGLVLLLLLGSALHALGAPDRDLARLASTRRRPGPPLTG
ncbi:MAG: hypothetical protein ACUVXG_02865 [Anaerolineae bacterium]